MFSPFKILKSIFRHVLCCLYLASLPAVMINNTRKQTDCNLMGDTQPNFYKCSSGTRPRIDRWGGRDEQQLELSELFLSHASYVTRQRNISASPPPAASHLTSALVGARKQQDSVPLLAFVLAAAAHCCSGCHSHVHSAMFDG